MLDIKSFKLVSKVPEKNQSQEWWIFKDKYSHLEVVVRNWKPNTKKIQGKKELVQQLHNMGLLDSPCTIDLEFLKKYQIDSEKAQTTHFSEY